MIVDVFANAGAYAGLGPRFVEAFAWLESGAWKGLAAGKHEIRGKELWVNVVRAETKAPESIKWEAHRRYADIQCVIDGLDLLGWAPLSRVRLGAYDEEKDSQALEADTWQNVELGPGDFAILLPGDAHRPGGAKGAPARLEKLVIKVLLQ
jgi:YhcH/YjgK/YiaL family protein